MSRQLNSLASTGLLLAACCASAAAPPTGSTVPAAGAIQKTPVPASDGNLHVTINIQVNLTKLNPLATRAALVCHGTVDDGQAFTSKANSIATSTGGSSSANSASAATFDALLHAYPNAQLQTNPITLVNGSYQGLQTVSFTFLPSQFAGQPDPVFVGMCQLQLGDGSGMIPAAMDTAGDIQMPSSSNLQLVMNGQINLIVYQEVKFAPL
jgi:hypothetical protein